MRFKISRPPRAGESTREYLQSLDSWLNLLSESLNVVLSNLTEENFAKSTVERLFENKEEENDNI